MQIALIVDDNGTGLFRAPLYRFVQKLQGRAEFAIVSVVGQPLKLTDYTMDGRVLTEVLTSLSARPGTPDGGQLLQGIYEAALNLEKREAPRPIIVALSVPGEEHSTLPARHVLDTLKDSGASLHVFLVANSAVAPDGPGDEAECAPRREHEPRRGPRRRRQAVGRTPRRHRRGRRHTDRPAAARRGPAPPVQSSSTDLPPGTKSSDRISVSAKRKGVNLRVPSRIPNR